MAVKHFIVSPTIESISKEEIESIEQSKFSRYAELQKSKNEANHSVKSSGCDLKHVEGRVVIEVDIQRKNWHTFSDGTKIRRERQFNDFNKRVTEPVNAIVISADKIPSGSEILIHHNSVHDTNRIFDYGNLSGTTESSDIKYYAIPEAECYAWRDESGTLQPMKNYAFALRCFEPYKGVISGIEPTQIKNVLYIVSGNLHGNVCHVLPSSDYEIVFQGQSGREEKVIRCRHYEDEDNDRQEIIAVDNTLTERINNGELLVGLSSSSANVIDQNIVS